MLLLQFRQYVKLLSLIYNIGFAELETWKGRDHWSSEESHPAIFSSTGTLNRTLPISPWCFRIHHLTCPKPSTIASIYLWKEHSAQWSTSFVDRTHVKTNSNLGLPVAVLTWLQGESCLQLSGWCRGQVVARVQVVVRQGWFGAGDGTTSCNKQTMSRYFWFEAFAFYLALFGLKILESLESFLSKN